MTKINLREFVPKNFLLCICGLLLIILILVFLDGKYSNFLITNKSNDIQSSKNHQVKTELGNIDLGNGSNKKNPVIDQTIKSSHAADLNNQSASSVLGTIDEKVEVEVILFDGEKNQTLNNYDLEFKFKGNSNREAVKSKTNAEGKFIVTVSRETTLAFVVSTKDYADSLNYLDLFYGKNECKVILYPGGTIEIKATNLKGKTVEGLKAFQVNHNLDGYINWESIPVTFDLTKDLYFITKSPFNRQELFFEAIGYQLTPLYTFNVLPNTTNCLSLKFLRPRKLYFDLNLKLMPDFISIKKPKVVHKDGLLRLESLTKVIKNKDGVYEYELDDNFLPRLVIYAEGYLPSTIEIDCHIDNYKVLLIKGSSLEIKVVNEKGEAINEASITYSVKDRDEMKMVFYSMQEKADIKTGTYVFYSDNSVNITVMTNKDGFAKLEGLIDESSIAINVFHHDFAEYNSDLEFCIKDPHVATIVLKSKINIFGKIKCGGKNVAGAIIYLSNASNPILETKSDSNGCFSYNLLNGNYNYEDYNLTAFHVDYGVANSIYLKPDQKNMEINLELINELSCRIMIVDKNASPVPNKKLILKLNTNHLYGTISNPITFKLISDSKGIAEAFNIPNHSYTLSFENEPYLLKDTFWVPNNELEVIEEVKRDLRKLIISLPIGSVYSGNFKVTGREENNNGHTFIIYSEKNVQYIELETNDDFSEKYRLVSFDFELPGFPIVTLGEFATAEDVPKEFEVEFKNGFNFKVKVQGFPNDKPLSGISVQVLSKDEKLLYSLPSDEFGEVNFSCLNGEYILEVNEPDFTPCRYDLNIMNNSEMLINLKKGGGLKAHLTFPENFKSAELFFNHDSLISSLDSAKDFEAFNIKPGVYDFYVILYFVIGQPERIYFPAKLIIENDKILVINLDDLKNNKTTVTIIVKNQNNEIIPSASFRLFVGSKYQLENFSKGLGFQIRDDGSTGTISLLPKTYYYGTLESNSNYQIIVIEPFELKPEEQKTIECILPYSRKLKKIQVLDVDGNPIEGAEFIFKDNKGNYLAREYDDNLKISMLSLENGFFSEIGWPKIEFNLLVSKTGYEFKEITIGENQPPDQLIQIKLNKASSIRCDFSNMMYSSISIGLLNNKAQFFELPIIDFYINGHMQLPNYRTDIKTGSHLFSNLAAGTYYIGYFKDGTKELISKQGPFTLGVEENLVIKSNFELKEK